MKMRQMFTSSLGVLFAAFLLFTVVYLPLYLLAYQHTPFMFLGTRTSWFLVAWSCYGVIVGGLALMSWINSGERLSGEEASFGPVTPSRWLRRTGIAGTDWLILGVAVFAMLLWLRSPFWLPWISVTAVVFGLIAIATPVETWPIHPRRDIPEPDPLPVIPPGEDTISRTWDWDCRARSMRAILTLRIRVKQTDYRSKNNPSRQGVTTTGMDALVHQIVEEGSNDREPAEAARQLLAFARNQRFNYFEEAQNTLQFVQVIPYAHDQATF